MTSFSKNLADLVEFPRQGIYSKIISKSKGSEQTLFCMAKGEELSEHTSSREAVINVIEGRGIFYVGKKKIIMEPGIFIKMPAGTAHSLKATTNLAFLLSLHNAK